ncbi:MAG TPA: thioredoxin family protein [Candidatus Hydrogenedentes bacterium]|nr:thioredoxin family protein [Candidatus Hydrogenedentota bacterium]
MKKAFIVIVLVAAVCGVLYAKSRKSEPATPVDNTAPSPALNTASSTGLPRLVDLGATKCIPCKMMAPILEELKKTYTGKFEVVFIDVWEKPDEAKQYKINLIPTQIFYDASGKERFRHEGFFSREDILSKWKELGIDLASKQP